MPRSRIPPAAALALLVACGEASREVAVAPVVPGASAAGLSARVRGTVLLEELGCVACHEEGTAAPQRGPDLATLASRVRPGFVARFLADPLGVRPGTAMPDLLRDRDARSREAAAEALACYVLSFAKGDASAETGDPEAAARGRSLFHEIGCVACHAPRDAAGRETALPGSLPLGDLSAKYAVPGLRAFLLAPGKSRMPDLRLSPSEAHDLASFLLQGTGTATTPEPARDQALVATGRTLFAERGCAHCHALPDAARPRAPRPKALSELDPKRGCLSGARGAWPFWALTNGQREELTAALRDRAKPLADEERILAMLAARNCLACHARGEAGGVTPGRDAFFVSADPSVGNESRLPPPLTGVGAKLQRAWLVDAIAHGQTARPYLRTRMPGFGPELAAELGELLARTDVLPPLALAPLPSDEKQARALTDLGRELVGEKGMNCIACHLFAGERVGTMGALDLVESTAQRLRPEWFAHYLRAPLRFKPGTTMPTFFPDGVSVRKELGNGDTATQIAAIWHYLAEGRNVGKPQGMRRPPIELGVDKEAVMLRRSVQATGKRGIGVGYPLGVNLTFDAERLGLNQIWWGKFVDAAPVWTGQGSGEARILGKDRVTLPNGPAFAVLSEADAKWPTASRRELGHRFLGYDLDEAQRPTFRYVCDDVTIADTCREVPSAGKPLLRRTLHCTAAKDVVVTFRAARAPRVDDLGAGLVQVGTSLRVTLPKDAFRIRSEGSDRELLVAIPIEHGQGELVLEYAWQEAGK